MKNICTALLLCLLSVSSFAQAIDPAKSAKAAANNDNSFIAARILDNKDAIFLSQKGTDRAVDSRVKELAQQMVTDYSAMLYSMEQLQVAGSKQKGTAPAGARQQAALMNKELSTTTKENFDSVWVAGMLNMLQPKYDELAQNGETAANPQLKMTIKEALPLMRKHITQLKSIQKYLFRTAQQKRREEAMEKKMRELEQKNK